MKFNVYIKKIQDEHIGYFELIGSCSTKRDAQRTTNNLIKNGLAIMVSHYSNYHWEVHCKDEVWKFVRG